MPFFLLDGLFISQRMDILLESLLEGGIASYFLKDIGAVEFPVLNGLTPEDFLELSQDFFLFIEPRNNLIEVDSGETMLG